MDQREQRRPSGIVIPDTVDRGSLRTGVVLRLGPGRRDHATGMRVPMDPALRAGVRVVFLKFQAFEAIPGARGGVRRAHEAEECLLHESDILGLWDGPPETLG